MSIKKTMREIQEMDLSKKVKYQCCKNYKNQTIILAGLVEGHQDKSEFAKSVCSDLRLSVNGADVEHTYTKVIGGQLYRCAAEDQDANPVTWYQVRNKGKGHFMRTELYLIHENKFFRVNPEIK